jgi:hypothetical protein
MQALESLSQPYSTRCTNLALSLHQETTDHRCRAIKESYRAQGAEGVKDLK